MSGDRVGEDLMTRREVAFLFRATSQAVAAWARRGRLTEVRNAEGKPRYRRAEVEELFRSVSSGGEPPGTDPGPDVRPLESAWTRAKDGVFTSDQELEQFLVCLRCPPR